MAILLLTRPAAASIRTKGEVVRLRPDVRVIVSPVMEIVPVPFTPEAVPAALILTSENGAEAAGQMGLPPGLPAICVGARTAEVARAQGFAAESAEGDAEALIEMILSRADPGPMLHLRGAHARGDIAPRLRAAGRQVADAVVYRQDECPLTEEARVALRGAELVVVPVYSPRSAAILAQQGPFSAPLRVIAISRSAAKAAGALSPERISQIDNPDGQSMLSAIVDSLED